MTLRGAAKNVHSEGRTGTEVDPGSSGGIYSETQDCDGQGVSLYFDLATAADSETAHENCCANWSLQSKVPAIAIRCEITCRG